MLDVVSRTLKDVASSIHKLTHLSLPSKKPLRKKKGSPAQKIAGSIKVVYSNMTVYLLRIVLKQKE